MKHIINFYRSGKLKIPPLLMLIVTFSFAFGVRVKADFSLTGPTLICTSGQYTVQNYSNETLVWSSSSNLTLTSTQGQNPATFSANGSGTGWVKATITCCGKQYNLPIGVWIGPPADPTGVSSESGMWGYAGNSYSFAVWPYDPYDEQEPDPILYVDPEEGTSLWYDYQNYFQIYFEYAGHYKIWATFENACGESDPVYLNYEGPYSYSTGYEILE